MNTSSSSSSEFNEVCGVGGYYKAMFPDDDICSCCAAMTCVIALYVSGTLFGICGLGDEQGQATSLSLLDR